FDHVFPPSVTPPRPGLRELLRLHAGETATPYIVVLAEYLSLKPANRRAFLDEIYRHYFPVQSATAPRQTARSETCAPTAHSSGPPPDGGVGPASPGIAPE